MYYIFENNKVVSRVENLVIQRIKSNGREIATATFSCDEVKLLSARELDLANRIGSIIFVLVERSTFSSDHVSFQCIVTEQAKGDKKQIAAAIREYEGN